MAITKEYEHQMPFPIIFDVAAVRQEVDPKELLGIYEPASMRGNYGEVFPLGQKGATVKEVVNNMCYSPLWMKDLFGAESHSIDIYKQTERENSFALKNGLKYSEEAIKLGLHINRHAVGTERSVRNSWYDCKPGTHPVFFLNYLRFCLRNNLFESLEEANTFLKGDQPKLKVADVFVKDNKFIRHPEDLPRDIPLALIHGRFLGVTHLDHEKAVMSLNKLKKEEPDLAVVLAVDRFAANISFANDTYLLSLASTMKEVDYTTMIEFPKTVLKGTTHVYDGYFSEIMWVSDDKADAFYGDYYKKVFGERKKKFLYVNPNHPVEFKERYYRTCREQGIIPVGREGGTIWSNSILFGDGRLPDVIESPYRGKLIQTRYEGYDGKMEEDGEEIILDYQQWLAWHIAETYLKDKSLSEKYAAHYLFGELI